MVLDLISLILELIGLGLLVAAAWLFQPVLGLAAAGVALLLIGEFAFGPARGRR